MTQEEIQKKYDHLLDRVARMRNLQINYDRYRVSADRDKMVSLQRQVDELVKNEFKAKRSQQKDLF